MVDNSLKLNADKTEIFISAPPSLISKIRDGLGSLTPLVKSSIRNLGVTMDQALTLDQHVNCLICSCFFQLRDIAKLRPHYVSSRDRNVNSCFYIILS